MKNKLRIVIFCFFIVILIRGLVDAKRKESPLYKDRTVDVEIRIKDLLSRMTLQEKIGQMAQAERGSIAPAGVAKYFIGSVLSGGGSSPQPNTPEKWADMYDRFQQAALETRLGIPIIYGVDSVHGHNNLKGATIFPHNIGLGASRDPELLQKIGEITAMETAATGVDWTFAPCVAVARDERWGRTYESFGETPELQELLVGQYIKGLQGPKNEMGGRYIAATAKHYLGDGGTVWRTGDAGFAIDRGDVRVSEKELRTLHLPGYIEAIKAGVASVMVSFSSYQGVKMHAHQYLISDLLKKELRFQGFVVSDWEGVKEIPALNYYTKVVQAVNAGIDMFMEPNSWREFIAVLKMAVEKGEVSEERINDAVRRILRVKFQTGLFETPYADRSLLQQKIIGCLAHREVARDAVRKSLVLLKNKDQVLPLSRYAQIYITGSNMDDLGNQCGGWTISWQGSSGNITEGTTVRGGIEEAIAGKGRIVSEPDEADVIVAVIGERPYAEGRGDNGQLSLNWRDLEIIEEVKEAGKPVVVIMISGRPLIVTDYINDWDAFVAAWLPGTEGQGIADVIFGDYNFTGKLPITWPRSIAQLPLNYGDQNYNPLFSYGYGLVMDLGEKKGPYQWFYVPFRGPRKLTMEQ